MAKTVVIISPNSIVREGLSRIISDEDFHVVDAASEPGEIDWTRCPQDVLAVIDVGSIEDQGALVDQVLQRHSNARCIILSDEFDLDTMVDCFQRNAQGYLVKDMPCSPLIASLQLASLGEKVLPSSLIDVLAKQQYQPISLTDYQPAVEQANLSQREMDVLCCLMTGYSNKVIARQLELSEATVKVHVKAILRKLKVGNRTQAAMWGTAHQVSIGSGPIHVN